MNYRRVKKYFKGFSSLTVFGVCILCLGLMFVCFDLSVHEGLVFPYIMVIAGVTMIIPDLIFKMNDSDYDALVNSSISDVEQKAVNKLGLSLLDIDKNPPIVLSGYEFSGTGIPGIAAFAKRGKDKIWRTNRYKAMVFFFTGKQIYCYTYAFCTTASDTKETTDEFSYKDIVSFTTESDTAHFNNKPVNYEYLKLTTTGGHLLTVSLKDIDNAQASINKMRNIIRQKKGT